MNTIIKKKPVVLIADDDKETVTVLSKLMSGQGYDVATVFDGKDAYNYVCDSKPDLIIADNYMPGLTGKDLCRRIKDNPSTRLIPVIIITGYSTPAEKIGSIEAGADDFVAKPYKTIELITRVKSLLHAKSLNDQLDSAESVIFALAQAIEAKDMCTQGHTERVSRLALLMGHQLALSEEEQKALYKGGILHDIGKIAVPDAILNKPSRLNESEFSEIKCHPGEGEKICRNLNSIQSAIDIIRSHHERYDGSGYPDQLVGENIPLIARIMSIVDVYDALTSKRPYKTALSQVEAFKVLDHEADMNWWDKKILTEFKKIVSKM